MQEELSNRQITLRRWQAAVKNAHAALESIAMHNAIAIMNESQKYHEEMKRQDETPLQWNDAQLNRIWLAYQGARRTNDLGQFPIKGVVTHAYHDDTLLIVNYHREVPEIYATHRQHGTMLAGIILDGEIQITC